MYTCSVIFCTLRNTHLPNNTIQILYIYNIYVGSSPFSHYILNSIINILSLLYAVVVVVPFYIHIYIYIFIYIYLYTCSSFSILCSAWLFDSCTAIEWSSRIQNGAHRQVYLWFGIRLSRHSERQSRVELYAEKHVGQKSTRLCWYV